MTESALERLACLARQTGVEVWVVGGAVRDRLLGRASPDVDLACRDALPLARDLARGLRAAFVPLDADRGTARVVGRDGTQLDLNELRGTLDEDLRGRDFTINAVACPLEAWLAVRPDWVDPTGGLADLEHRVLRAVGPGSLTDDPLRCLRAWRLAAGLGLAVAAGTRELVRAAAPGLDGVASERVLQEWLPLLAAAAAPDAVAGLIDDGLLARLLPAAPVDARERLAAFETLAAIAPIDDWLAAPEHRALARWAVLAGPHTPEAHLTRRFAVSREQSRWLKLLRRAPLPAAAGREALAELALACGVGAPARLLVAAAAGELGETTALAGRARLIAEILPIWHQPPLVTGHDLRDTLGIPPGPVYQRALRAVRLAQLAGRVAGRDDALEIARAAGM